MHYYQFNIGDYASHTAHLEPLEDLAYRRMLDLYYLSQAPLPSDVQRIAKLIRMPDHADIVREILNEFFKPTDDGWANTRADGEIQAYTRMANGGAKGAAKRWHKAGDSHPIATPCPPHTPPHDNPNSKQETITIKQETVNNIKAQAPKQKASKRCPADFVVTRDMVDWASENGLTVDLNAETEKFRDHEYKTAKTDWLACWRTWMRNAQQYKREPLGGVSFRERDAQLASDRVAQVAPSIAANKTAPYVDAADFIEALSKSKPLGIKHG